jgi:hypothetical protein
MVTIFKVLESGCKRWPGKDTTNTQRKRCHQKKEKGPW